MDTQSTTACCLGCTQSGVFLDVNVDVQAITVLLMEIMFMIKGMLIWVIIITSGIRAVMGFGTSCKASDPKHKCSSRWNSSAFHIAVSHSTNANQMSAWMPVVQALTQHPIIDWIGFQGLLRMQRTCFTKLIVGQSAALHLYNDHRLLPFPSYYPHPEFEVAGLCCLKFLWDLCRQSSPDSFCSQLDSLCCYQPRRICTTHISIHVKPTVCSVRGGDGDKRSFRHCGRLDRYYVST
jgi:hypothetical protein